MGIRLRLNSDGPDIGENRETHIAALITAGAETARELLYNFVELDRFGTYCTKVYV